MLYVPQIRISVSLDRGMKSTELHRITSSKDAADLFRQIFDADTFLWSEEFIMLCLNNSNRVTGFFKISSGGMTGTVVDLRMIFATAYNCCATGLIMAHNHPSGTLIASDADRQLTKKLKQAGEIMDIKILDHLILNDSDYYSFADDGIL
jgi:DNA repair protein RadC